MAIFKTFGSRECDVRQGTQWHRLMKSYGLQSEMVLLRSVHRQIRSGSRATMSSFSLKAEALGHRSKEMRAMEQWPYVALRQHFKGRVPRAGLSQDVPSIIKRL